MLAAFLEPGDSGGALVNTSGDAIGIAFAVAPGSDGTSYALAADEVRAVLNDVGSAQVETGTCLIR